MSDIKRNIDNEKRIFLFDVDGTLTPSRKVISAEMDAFLKDLRSKARVGIVGGSDLEKQKEQLGEGLVPEWDYVFSENGLMAFKDGKLLEETSMKKFMGEERLKEFINFCLHYMADLDIPIKRGTFLEFRTGMINVCPIGRNCTQEERDAFGVYDDEHKVREKFVEALEAALPHLELSYSIGGQISFDVFPKGWDKTFCLKYLEADGFTEIHFFGDKTMQGGNDHEIFENDKTIGHTVTSPADTRAQVNQVLGI